MKRIHRLAYLPLALILLAAVSVADSGCGASDGPAATGITGVATSTATAAQAGTSKTGTSETLTTAGEPTVESITHEVSSLRGLPVLQKIGVSYISRDQLGDEMEKAMEDEFPGDDIAVEEKVLKQLGLIDADANLEEMVSSLLGEEVLGYYDDETRELKVVSDSDEMNPLNEITLAHEITHALQDQSFSFESILPSEGSGNDDRDLAVLALIEGDATVVEEDYASANMGLSDAVALVLSTMGATTGLDSSSYVEQNIIFPYIQGREFILDMRKSGGGWQAVDGIYSRPPASTEQVMHPDKYIVDEAPVDVKAPDLGGILGGDWKKTYENVMGEFDALGILETGVTQSKAERAAAGWGGGRLEFYERGNGEQALVMVLTWDSPADADEFTLALAESLENRTGSRFVFEAGRLPCLSDGRDSWVLAQRGVTTVIVSAPERGIGESIVSLILALP